MGQDHYHLVENWKINEDNHLFDSGQISNHFQKPMLTHGISFKKKHQQSFPLKLSCCSFPNSQKTIKKTPTNLSPSHSVDGLPHGGAIAGRQHRLPALPEAEEFAAERHNAGEVGPAGAVAQLRQGWLKSNGCSVQTFFVETLSQT